MSEKIFLFAILIAVTNASMFINRVRFQNDLPFCAAKQSCVQGYVNDKIDGFFQFRALQNGYGVYLKQIIYGSLAGIKTLGILLI